jgi:predicted dehydrogenase
MSGPSIALIGCGAATTSYYIPALKKLPEICKHLILVDSNLARAKAVGEELGSSRFTNNYAEILDRVQGVIIAVPHFLHYSISMDCLRRRVHVFCEKPVAVTGGELRSMIDEAACNGVALCVNNTRRMFPNFRHIKQMLASGELGMLQTLRMLQGEKFGWQSLTGFYVDPTISSKGVLLDLGAHLLDLACWWLGEKPQIVQFQDDSFGGPESVAYVRAKTRDCRLDIKLNRLSDIKSYYAFQGTKGVVECNPDDWGMLKWTPKGGRTTEMTFPSQERTYKEFVGTLVDNFLAVIEGKEKPLIQGTDVCPSIELIDECYSKRQRFSLPWVENVRVALHDQ